MRDGFRAGLRKQLASDLSVVSANLGVEAGFGKAIGSCAWGRWVAAGRLRPYSTASSNVAKTVTAPPRRILYSPGNSLISKPLRRSSVLIISNDGMVRLQGLHKQSVIQYLALDAHIVDFLGIDLFKL